MPEGSRFKKKKKKKTDTFKRVLQEGSISQVWGYNTGLGNVNPLQYSCLKNSTDRAAWQATAQGVTKSWTGLSDWAHTHIMA